jgi:hypothetical protein
MVIKKEAKEERGKDNSIKKGLTKATNQKKKFLRNRLNKQQKKQSQSQ